MKIRKATIVDAREISRVKCYVIKNVNSKDYSPRQIKAWLIGNRTKAVREKLKKGKLMFVVEESNKIKGVGSLNLDEKEVGSLYVKDFGKGFGGKLLHYMEDYAKKHGIKELQLHSTTTAYEFYKKKGYKTIRKEMYSLRGVEVPSILMKKLI